ncbi:endonuclease/exonuclease/phosphatase family protein [Streptomyces sp. B6B3]|uniref:endonuclease/exonuclease/phosphatase family protein n=1 Tax=Streptomyces sp. B6B3 TaxID=3153570 RepID=UPI00325D2FCE
MTLAARTPTLLTAVTALTALELLRLAGAQTGTATGTVLLVTLGLAAAALAGPLVWWLGVRRALTAAVGALAVARLLVQFPGGRAVPLVALAVAVAFAALVLAARRCAATRAGPGRAARAVALAVAADVALRLTLHSWDPVWRGGALGWLVALVLAALLAGLAWHAYLEVSPAAARPGGNTGVELALLGPALALYGAFLASPGFVAAQGGVSFTTAGLWISAGSLLGVWSLSLSPRDWRRLASRRIPPFPPRWPARLRPRWPDRLTPRLPRALGRALSVPRPALDGPGGAWPAPAVLVAAVLAFLLLPATAPVAAAAGIAALPVVLRAVLAGATRTGHGALVDLALAGAGCGLGYQLLVLPDQLRRFAPEAFPVAGALALGAVAWLNARRAATAPEPAPVPAGAPAEEPREPQAPPAGPGGPDEPSAPAASLAPLPTAFVPVLLAALLLAFPPLASAARPAPDPLPTDTAGPAYQLMTWNVHYAVDGDGDLAPDDILRVIRDSGAHVVVLQEVPRGWGGAGGLDLASWLAERLDTRAVWAPAADRQFGNLVLTSLPVVDSAAVGLPRAGGSMDRSYASVTVRLADGTTARVLTSHLEGGDAVSTRNAQIEPLLAAARHGPAEHTVLAGDFNAQPDSVEIDTIRRAGFASAQDEAGDPDRITHLDPRRRVDWIFGAAGVTFENFRILDNDAARASDHLPLTVTVWLD